jgi:hypothetical protein
MSTKMETEWAALAEVEALLVEAQAKAEAIWRDYIEIAHDDGRYVIVWKQRPDDPLPANNALFIWGKLDDLMS